MNYIHWHAPIQIDKVQYLFDVFDTTIKNMLKHYTIIDKKSRLDITLRELARHIYDNKNCRRW